MPNLHNSSQTCISVEIRNLGTNESYRNVHVQKPLNKMFLFFFVDSRYSQLLHFVKTCLFLDIHGVFPQLADSVKTCVVEESMLNRISLRWLMKYIKTKKNANSRIPRNNTVNWRLREERNGKSALEETHLCLVNCTFHDQNTYSFISNIVTFVKFFQLGSIHSSL